jgi:hypothetical protein
MQKLFFKLSRSMMQKLLLHDETFLKFMLWWKYMDKKEMQN